MTLEAQYEDDERKSLNEEGSNTTRAVGKLIDVTTDLTLRQALVNSFLDINPRGLHHVSALCLLLYTTCHLVLWFLHGSLGQLSERFGVSVHYGYYRPHGLFAKANCFTRSNFVSNLLVQPPSAESAEVTDN